jgi:hypothetical protein
MGHDYCRIARAPATRSSRAAPSLGAPTQLVELPVSGRWTTFRTSNTYAARLRAMATCSKTGSRLRLSLGRIAVGRVTYTFHPFVIGRGHRMKMLEITHRRADRARRVFVTAEQAVAEFSERERGYAAPPH